MGLQFLDVKPILPSVCFVNRLYEQVATVLTTSHMYPSCALASRTSRPSTLTGEKRVAATETMRMRERQRVCACTSSCLRAIEIALGKHQCAGDNDHERHDHFRRYLQCFRYRSPMESRWVYTAHAQTDGRGMVVLVGGER